MCFRIENTLSVLERVTFREIFTDPGGIDGSVNHNVGDMDSLRAQFPGQTLAECAQAELCAGKRQRSPLPPRRLAVAPVNRILPLPRGNMQRAASRPARKPAKQAISQTFLKTREVISVIGKLTFAPMLKITDSSGAISVSM